MLLRRPHDLAGLFRDGRARAGWSQSELAERVGVSRQWISLVENGKLGVELGLAMKALQALGYSIHVKVTSPEDAQADEATTHGAIQRTPLTQRGKPLRRHGTRRPARRDRP